MKAIIASTSFSTVSVNAVNYAADMAEFIGANLYIVHYYDMPLILGDATMPAALTLKKCQKHFLLYKSKSCLRFSNQNFILFM